MRVLHHLLSHSVIYRSHAPESYCQYSSPASKHVQQWNKKLHWEKKWLHALSTGQTIHNRILSKVCCDGFTREIRNSARGELSYVPWNGSRGGAVFGSTIFLSVKSSVSTAFMYKRFRLSGNSGNNVYNVEWFPFKGATGDRQLILPCFLVNLFHCW